MECRVECPMLTVDGAVYALRRISSLCHVMTELQCSNDAVAAESVGDMMGLIRDCLDEQIKVLDGIQWSPRKRARA